MANPPDHRTTRAAPFDLRAAARKSMLENGFIPDPTPAAVEQTKALPPAPGAGPGLRDLTALLWSSIDNQESRDLDQIEVAERLPSGNVRLRVGIADVDSLVARGTPIDQLASANTASIYTGAVIFPMLPEVLSCDRTSLNHQELRRAIVVEMDVAPDGSIGATDVYGAMVVNRGKLAYDEIGDWLEGKTPLPARVAAVPGLEEQLRLQDEVGLWLHRLRHARGALELETIEAQPVAVDGQVVELKLTRKSRSREIIEDFMIAANGTMARFLDARGRSSIRRVVRTPARWPRIVELAGTFGVQLPAVASPKPLSDFLEERRKTDPAHFADVSLAVVKLLGPGEYELDPEGKHPEGHFGLAVQDYTHSTAPNRRFADLVTQRLLKAALAGAPQPYTNDELAAIARRCTERDTAARKVERTMRKIAAALLLQPRLGEVFDAIVTGVTDHGTFVRLLDPPAEGRVVRGERGVDVGDQLRVKLVATEPSKGFIDFVRA